MINAKPHQNYCFPDTHQLFDIHLNICNAVNKFMFYSIKNIIEFQFINKPSERIELSTFGLQDQRSATEL